MTPLFDLLPALYRERDAARGGFLAALLGIVDEQVGVVEDDLLRLWDNWFIETCEDWVVPYLGELVGWVPASDPAVPAPVPRREVANTLRYRRRKGTLPVLELLARDVAGWPGRAVEFAPLLVVGQHVNHVRPDRGRLGDVRDGAALDRLGSPFERVARLPDVRGLRSARTPGRHNPPAVGVFVWRLRAYPVTETPAYAQEAVGPHTYTFSVLGNDAPLFTRPEVEPDDLAIATERTVPAPLTRRALQERLAELYGPGRSLAIRTGADQALVPPERIVPADLSGWRYRPRRGTVAVDPELGRIAFPPGELPRRGVWVSYHYGFSADLGGGEYARPAAVPPGAAHYRVGKREPLERINDALARWQQERPERAVIEVVDSGVYVEQLHVELAAGQRLELRAADRRRPVLRLLDWQTSLPDALSVTSEEGGCFVLDGFLVTGRGVQVGGAVEGLVIRHTTLVPGWTLGPDCAPQRPNEPSIILDRTRACVLVDRSIVGSIQANQDEVASDPLALEVRDSIVDATSPEREAIGAPGWPFAHVTLTVRRSTIVGEVAVHALALAEDTIFAGTVHVARRQVGCVRFCSLARPCRTPRRFNCQPDLVEQALRERVEDGLLAPAALPGALERERRRVRPVFASLRYGTPAYGRLADHCAVEIREGASDGSEMGAFHDLYEPQRGAALRARLAESTPAGFEPGTIHAT